VTVISRLYGKCLNRHRGENGYGAKLAEDARIVYNYYESATSIEKTGHMFLAI